LKFQVFIGGGDAHTMLWHFCFGHEAQTPFVKEMVSSLLSVCRMMLNRDFYALKAANCQGKMRKDYNK